MNKYELPIHFGNNQGEHAINSDSLAVFINSYKEIFEEFTGSKINIEIGVPEEGGWKTKLAIALVGFVGLDNTSILLTGKPSTDLFYSANKFIVKFITDKESNISEDYPRKCIEQKNKIYQQFQKDKCIDSFDLEDIPPIPKSDFSHYIKKLDEEEDIYLGILDIIVSSHDWKGRRSWQGKIEGREEENTFDFEKDLTGKFWEFVKLDKLPLHTPTDKMLVQLVNRPNNKIKYRVIRVLKYNEVEIDTKLSDTEITKITNKVFELEEVKLDDRQSNLFESLSFKSI